MNWPTYLPYIYSYLAVGAYMAAAITYHSFSSGYKRPESYWEFAQAIVLHLLCWPITLSLVVSDAIAEDS